MKEGRAGPSETVSTRSLPTPLISTSRSKLQILHDKPVPLVYNKKS